MAYTKQGFYSGDKLKASQLDLMEDGIIEAQELAQAGAAGAANMEKGAGDLATQSLPRPDKVSQAEGETAPHFSFTGHPDAGMAGRIEYGAVGNYSVALTGRSAALNKHAFAINNSTVAKGEECFAQGYETIAEGNSSVATGSRTWAKGVASHTEGLQTYTEGEGSHAEGGETKAMGKYSHAEGEKTTAHGDNSHTEGALTQAGSFGAHAEGNETIADTNASHAEGSANKVVSYTVVDTTTGGGSSGSGSGGDVPSYDDYTDLEDYRRRAAACGHSEGNNNTTMGYGAHSEGVGTTAYGNSSHTEGWGTQAGDFVEEVYENGQTLHTADRTKGLAAHAEGYNTKALANYSHTAGIHTVADKDGQTVVGRYNNLTSQEGSVFVVGGGQDEHNRKNALEVIQNGEIILFLNNSYYSLNDILNLLANKFGGFADRYFDPARR